MAGINRTGRDICALPTCENPSSARMSVPVCGDHAQHIYLSVKDMIEAATVAERVNSARPPRLSATRNQNRQPGFVYFMQFGDLVKIGWSVNPSRRAKELRPDRIILSIPGTRLDERAMHARFGPLWERAEYFRNEGELAEFLTVRVGH